MNTVLEHRTWRYATKKFDASKILSHEKVNILKDSILMFCSLIKLKIKYKI